MPKASAFNSNCLDIFSDTIEHPSKKLFWFAFAWSFRIQFRVSWYITELNLTSGSEVIVVWIYKELPFSISRVSIYYGTLSDIRVKSYCRLNLLRASTFNFERSDILRDSIRHPSKRLLSFEFAESIYFQFRASRYISRLNRTSE